MVIANFAKNSKNLQVFEKIGQSNRTYILLSQAGRRQVGLEIFA